MSTTRSMQDASPTDVPPNFITWSGFFISLKSSRRCSQEVPPARALWSPFSHRPSNTRRSAFGCVGYKREPVPASPTEHRGMPFEEIHFADLLHTREDKARLYRSR